MNLANDLSLLPRHMDGLAARKQEKNSSFANVTYGEVKTRFP